MKPIVIKKPANLQVFFFDFPRMSNYICIFFSKYGKIKLLLRKFVFLNLNYENNGFVLVLKNNTKRSKNAYMFVKTYEKILSKLILDLNNRVAISLECCGIGYRFVLLNSRTILFFWGYSHAVKFYLPINVIAKVGEDKQRILILEGADRQLVHQTAAAILKLRKFNFYSGKGIKLSSTIVRLKEKKKTTTKK